MYMLSVAPGFIDTDRFHFAWGAKTTDGHVVALAPLIVITTRYVTEVDSKLCTPIRTAQLVFFAGSIQNCVKLGCGSSSGLMIEDQMATVATSIASPNRIHSYMVMRGFGILAPFTLSFRRRNPATRANTVVLIPTYTAHATACTPITTTSLPK